MAELYDMREEEERVILVASSVQATGTIRRSRWTSWQSL